MPQIYLLINLLLSFVTIFEMIYCRQQFIISVGTIIVVLLPINIQSLYQQVSYYSGIIPLKSVTNYSQNYSGTIGSSVVYPFKTTHT